MGRSIDGGPNVTSNVTAIPDPTVKAPSEPPARVSGYNDIRGLPSRGIHVKCPPDPPEGVARGRGGGLDARARVCYGAESSRASCNPRGPTVHKVRSSRCNRMSKIASKMCAPTCRRAGPSPA